MCNCKCVRSDATLFAYGALILGILIYTINCFWLYFQYLVYIVNSVIRLWITTFSTLRSWSGNRNLFRVFWLMRRLTSLLVTRKPVLRGIHPTENLHSIPTARYSKFKLWTIHSKNIFSPSTKPSVKPPEPQAAKPPKPLVVKPRRQLPARIRKREDQGHGFLRQLERQR